MDMVFLVQVLVQVLVPFFYQYSNVFLIKAFREPMKLGEGKDKLKHRFQRRRRRKERTVSTLGKEAYA